MNSFYEEIKVIFTDKRIAIKYAKMTGFLVLLAVVYNLFIVSIDLVAGGAGGLGVLANELFNIEPSVVIFFVSFVMFVLAFLYLDANQVVCTLFVTFIYPLLIKATSGVGDIMNVDCSHTLVIVIFAAVLTGVGQGSIFKLGLNIGSLSILSRIISKHLKVSVVAVNTAINAIIVLLGGVVTGLSMVFYAILFLFICKKVSDRIVLGASKNKTFKIISKNYKDIENFIYKELGHDVTLYDVCDSSSSCDKKMIMSVVPTSEFTILRDYVKTVDKSAFIFITDTYDVSGQDVLINA